MNKPTLTKEQAGMIENHRNSFETLMMKRVTNGCPTYLDDVPVEDVVIAFFDGYTVDQTPEEKVREYYNTLIQNEDCNVHECYAVNKVLELLDMQHILEEGVNDK